MGIGKFSEPKLRTRQTGINVGESNINDRTPNNDTLNINTGIGGSTNPKKYYNRQSEVKSEGGYIETKKSEEEK